MKTIRDIIKLIEDLEANLPNMNAQSNPEDTIKVDVPLFIRLLEYAREDANDDMALHTLTERLTKMCADGRTLGMDSYDELVNPKEEPQENPYDNDLADTDELDSNEPLTKWDKFKKTQP